MKVEKIPFRERNQMRRMLAILAVLALVLAACGGGDGTPATTSGPSGMTGDATAGETAFVTCAACHGPDATGIEGLGRDLTNSVFLADRTDDEMVDFIKVGRRPDDPANETGVDMPPNGGNPAFSDQDLYDVVAYLRTLPGN